MKKVILIALTMLLYVSCEQKSSTTNKRMVPDSSGNINNISIVADNALWEGSVGETIRKILAAPVYGLPQDEPMFSMNQMPPQVFSGFAAKNRTVLKIEKGKDKGIRFLKDVYAKPQKVVVVSGNTSAEIIAQLEENADRIVSAFKSEEIKEKQRRIAKSLHKTKDIENTLGLTIKFPSAYRIAKEDNGFFWIRKDIQAGSMNLMLYEMPLNYITEGENTIADIIKMRDSIGQKHIPGPSDGTYMITDEAYTPFMNKTIIDNKPAFETKSTWEVKGAFMAGPFINYIIEDEINSRLLVAEGFTFAPSVSKRDHIFELEAIIRSIEIK